jgi:hypothetical protein
VVADVEEMACVDAPQIHEQNDGEQVGCDAWVSRPLSISVPCVLSVLLWRCTWSFSVLAAEFGSTVSCA